MGVYTEANSAASAIEGLQKAGFAGHEYEVLTGAPYPEGAFGEPHSKHRLYFFPIVGACCGFAVALLLTSATQIAYPMVQGGKPILAVPPMLVIMYEGTMLGAILFTVLGIIFESRLPASLPAVYDRRISEGYVGVVVTAPEERLGRAIDALKQANPDVIHDERVRSPR